MPRPTPLVALTALTGLAAGLVALASPAAAQVTAEANVAKWQGQWGGEVGVGYPILQDGGFSVTPSVGAFVYDRDHPRYAEDGGVCYRRADDVAVKDSHCDGTGLKAYGRIEAMYSLPMVSLGVGARYMGDSVRAYGTAAMPVMPRIDAKVNVGDGYLSAGLLARF
ncbi:autotransporter outer membrane beta-barrel domain-containing protein [Novosphingobium sp. 1949]|uniref:Autotransporter outer membrane beta-barrel domain-containing protein n=1 Tax=Novosphingobium organovorum TaxID=2930092 RepID=A0ABT0BC53_9SPHN|nr:autotransporter outer membrane beta-barrel domain-containing protein [Novosphingobium organovorum]MCJ2182635.1 autotransporter outer membrane beta-barrel domain-containing protein [Novosphingobium organovorum]